MEGENISLAVKRISQNLSKKGKKKSSESQQEVENDTRRQIFCLSLSHENLVPLLHHHREQGLHLLIYEFMENGSLDQALFSNDSDTGTYNYVGSLKTFLLKKYPESKVWCFGFVQIQSQ